MKYQVLARRYRPRRFEEVVGQESVAATLRGAILQNRLAHAFLFTGPRGVGKTSMARIFAKALNCPRAADRTQDPSGWAQPCDACSTCEAIHTGQDIDVVELDGASHRGIEEIRSIIESVNRPATRGLFKIYIIDEVHMLTREAFNALLKTLEEPPAHVKFVFATTEAQRIPDTVLSRCQRFDFHPITDEAIARRLAQILSSEGRESEPNLLERVARYGRGGLRDSQTLLDQLMTYAEGVLKVEDLDRMTGRVPEDHVRQLSDAALAGRSAEVFSCTRRSFELGADPAILLDQVMDHLRTQLHEEVNAAKNSGPSVRIDQLLAFLQILIDASGRLKHSPYAELSVEVTLLKLSRLEDPAALEEVIRWLGEIEKRSGGARPLALKPMPLPAVTASTAAPPRSRPISTRLEDSVGAVLPPPVTVPSQAAPQPSATEEKPMARPGPPVAQNRSSPGLKQLLSVWDQVRIELEARHPDLAPFFRDITPGASSEPDTFTVEIRNEFCFRQMKAANRQESFLGLVREVAGYPWKALIRHEGKVITATPPLDRPGPLGPAGGQEPRQGQVSDVPGTETLPKSSPANGEGISRSPIVKKSVELFGGRLV